MPKKDRNDTKSRSVKLRKYASVYNSYIRNIEKNERKKSPPRRRSVRQNQTNVKKYVVKPKKRKKPLNKYQKFVQKESKKDIYNNIPAKERLKVIAHEWNKHCGRI